MGDNLLEMLMTGKSREEILFETTRDYLRSLPPEVEDAAYRGMIVHWFNPRILQALLRAGHLSHLGRLKARPKAATAEGSYAQLQTLPFVEDYPYQGHNFHELTRKIVLSELWEQEHEFYRKVSGQAAKYFGRLLSSETGASREEVVEYCYHSLIFDEVNGLETIEQMLDTYGSQGQVSACHALVEVAEEHLNAGRLSLAAAPRIQAYKIRIAFYADQYEQVELLANEMLSTADDIIPPAIKAPTLVFLAESLRIRGRYDDANKFFIDACNLYDQLGMIESLVDTLLRLGDAYFDQDQYDDALSIYLEALKFYVPQLLHLPADNQADDRVGKEAEPPEISAESAELQPTPELEPEQTEEEESITLALYVPDAWHRLVFEPAVENGSTDDKTDLEAILYYGIEQIQEETGADQQDEEGVDTEIPLVGIDVTILLAEIWMRLGKHARYTDRYELAASSFRLAGRIFGDLNYPYGVQRAVGMLYGIGVVEADLELIQASIEHQKYLLELSIQRDDLPSQLESLLALASAYENRSEHPQARQNYEDALQLAEEMQDHIGKASALVGLAHLDINSMKRQEAEVKLNLAMDIYRQINHLSGQARTYNELGYLEYARHKPELAIDHYENSLNIYTQLKMPSGQFDALSGLGMVSQDRAHFDDAISYYEQAYDIAHKLKVPSMETICLTNIADIYAETGQYEKARSNYEKVLEIAQEIYNQATLANTQVAMGFLLLDHQEFAEALDYFQKAKTNYVQVEDFEGQIRSIIGILRVHDEHEDVDQAVQVADELLMQLDQVSDQTIRRQVYMQIGLTYGSAGRSQQAIQIMEEVVRMDPDDPVGVGNYGWALYEAGLYERSLEYSQKAYQLDPRQTFALRNIGHAWLALGQPDKAEEYYRKAIRERKEGEHFKETIKVMKKLIKEKPDLPRGEELLSLIQDHQDRLDQRMALVDQSDPSDA